MLWSIAIALATPEEPPAAPSEETLEELQIAVAELQQQLTALRLERLPKDQPTLHLEGYYLAQANLYPTLLVQGDRLPALATHRVWLRPRLDYRRTSAWVEVRGLNNVHVGQNEWAPATLSRAWMTLRGEALTARVGRQPVRWGTGLWVDAGDRFDQRFGVPSAPTTTDRVELEGRPLQIYQRITGQQDTRLPLFLTLSLDALQEGDPFTADQDWWAQGGATQAVYSLDYRGVELPTPRDSADLAAGLRLADRWTDQGQTRTQVWDAFLDLRRDHLLVSGEAFGPTSARPAFMAQLGWTSAGGDLILEVGHDPVSEQSLGGFHPDHNVGLLLYEEIGRRLALAQGLDTRGAVVDSSYLFPSARWSPRPGWDLLTGGVWSWPAAGTQLMGWELDAGVHYRWRQHIQWRAEGAWAQGPDLAPVPVVRTPSGHDYTLQSSVAYLF